MDNNIKAPRAAGKNSKNRTPLPRHPPKTNPRPGPEPQRGDHRIIPYDALQAAPGAVSAHLLDLAGDPPQQVDRMTAAANHCKLALLPMPPPLVTAAREERRHVVDILRLTEAGI